MDGNHTASLFIYIVAADPKSFLIRHTLPEKLAVLRLHMLRGPLTARLGSKPSLGLDLELDKCDVFDPRVADGLKLGEVKHLAQPRRPIRPRPGR